MPRKFNVRQSHTPNKDSIRADVGRGFKSRAAHRSDQIILIDSVAANADGAGELTVLIKWDAAGKDLNAVCEIRNPRAVTWAEGAGRREPFDRANQKVELQSVVERAEVFKGN